MSIQISFLKVVVHHDEYKNKDFLELSCGELKFYLQQRAISIGWTLDLRERALVAFGAKYPHQTVHRSRSKDATA